MATITNFLSVTDLMGMYLWLVAPERRSENVGMFNNFTAALPNRSRTDWILTREEAVMEAAQAAPHARDGQSPAIIFRCWQGRSWRREIVNRRCQLRESLFFGVYAPIALMHRLRTLR